MSDKLVTIWYDDPTKNETTEHVASEDKQQTETPKSTAGKTEANQTKRLAPAQG